MLPSILTCLPENFPWKDQIRYFNSVTSTNDLAKAMAREGAPEGTVVIAARQTAGRGRLGRQFHAPEGLGLYFSLILRPNCDPRALFHLTCAAGVAACNAVEKAAGLRPRIKWTNDLVIGTKKLGGILTELSVAPDGKVDWAIIGIGINCLHQEKDFPDDIRGIATSIAQATNQVISPALLAAHLMQTLQPICGALLTGKSAIMEQYRKDCMTLNRQVVLLRGDEKKYGTALSIDDDGGLTVKFDDGTTETVQAGEISVRGMYGYV